MRPPINIFFLFFAKTVSYDFYIEIKSLYSDKKRTTDAINLLICDFCYKNHKVHYEYECNDEHFMLHKEYILIIE